MSIMRRFVKNSFLGGIFAAIAAFIMIQLMAEIEFDAAGKLALEHKWEKAEMKFEKAIKLDPFNSRYLSGFADFLMQYSSCLKDGTSVLNRADGLYAEAAKVNPSCAYYYLGMGQAELSLFLSDKKAYAHNLKAALDNFKKAAAKDPNGFNISYSIGYAGIMAWQILTEEQREFVFNEFAYSLKTKPWYAQYIYPHLWKFTKDTALLRRVTPRQPQLEEYLDYFLTQNNLKIAGKQI